MISRCAVVVGLCAVGLGAVGVAGCAVGGADELGTSDEALRATCGGFAGIACPDGYACVDDPRDSCDPTAGGADCGGICRRQHRERVRCDYRDPSREYIATDTATCSTIRFLCADGMNPFFDDCGCGCEAACLTTAFCVEGYAWDEASCSCVPTTTGETCGANVCGTGEVCCNSSCGICTPPDGVCTQQICETTTL